MPDIHIENHGSIVILNPVTPEAVEWFDYNVSAERWGGGYAIEPRYVNAILDGCDEAGLTFA